MDNMSKSLLMFVIARMMMADRGSGTGTPIRYNPPYLKEMRLRPETLMLYNSMTVFRR
jgi:hypothetical protein